MTSTSVKVAVRVRPMAAKELLANSSECISFIPGTTQIVVGAPASSLTSLSAAGASFGSYSGNSASAAAAAAVTAAAAAESVYWMPPKSFTFDYVFEPRTDQDSLHRSCVAPLVSRFLEGFNATVLAYGQTGSGKTYSMGIGLEGISVSSGLDAQGIVPRAIRDIFAHISDATEKGINIRSQVLVSFLELYNEELVDLLNPRPRTAMQQLPSNACPSIREDGTGKIVWLNVREEEVKSPEELMSVLQRGTLCRTTGSTDMNATSSRSHAIFSIILRQDRILGGSQSVSASSGGVSSSDGTAAAPSATAPVQTIVSKFHFVDLAGSERLKRTNAEGDRKKEGISINQGLLALGNVISALGDETRRSSHIPYRDSKLTRLLQDSLGGNSQTLMLSCVSPSDLNYAETVNTLHYANRARNIKNRVTINQEWLSSVAGGGVCGVGGLEKDREIKMLRQTVSQLRTELAMLRATGGIASVGGLESGKGDTSGRISGQSAAGLAPQRVARSGTTDASTAGSTTSNNANFLNEKEIQFYIRRERDLSAELDMYKSTQYTIRFNMERMQFRCHRLVSRVRELTQELARVSSERDVAVLEKSRMLTPGLKIRLRGDEVVIGDVPVPAEADNAPTDAVPAATTVSNQAVSDTIKTEDSSDNDSDVDSLDEIDIDHAQGVSSKGRRARKVGASTGAVSQYVSSDPKLLDVHPVVQGYIAAISALRIQLTETEDKLAWHTEAMSKLGRKGSRLAPPVIAWSEAEDKELGITSAPSSRSVAGLRVGAVDTEIGHERTLLRGLRENPLVRRMLQSVDTGTAGGTEGGDSGIGSLSSALSSAETTGDGNRQVASKTANFFVGIGSAIASAVSRSSALAGESVLAAPAGSSSGDGNDSNNNDIITTMGSNNNNTAQAGGNNSNDPDLYVIINKIQNDIAQHEALVERIQRRDAEYEVMKKAYEQKLNVLQSQLMRFQSERDQALHRMQEASGGMSKKDRAGTIAAARSRYDEEKRKLDTQIAEYRRKLGENSRLQTTNRSRGDVLTKELHATIESLKSEKARMLKELRKEAQKHRDMSTATQREIARLKRREKTAAETAKRLERSNQLQRVMIKKRNDEVARSQAKLKSVLGLLKRSSTPNRIFKSLGSLVGSGSASPSGRRSAVSSRPNTAGSSSGIGGGIRHHGHLGLGFPSNNNNNGTGADNNRGGSGRNAGGGSGNGSGNHSGSGVSFQKGMHRVLSGSAMTEFLAGVSSPIKISTGTIATTKPTVQIRAQFKKQMIDKELASCVLVRRTQAALQDLKIDRQKLVDEQRELITERGRVVQAEYERTGLYDADAPQYMDERLQMIDVQVCEVDKKMSNLEALIKRHMTLAEYESGGAGASGGVDSPLDREDAFSTNNGGGSSNLSSADLSWENALNLVRSLDRLELEAAAALFLEDIVDMRIANEESLAQIAQRDNDIAELKRLTFVLRSAATRQAQEVQEAQQHRIQAETVSASTVSGSGATGMTAASTGAMSDAVSSRQTGSVAYVEDIEDEPMDETAGDVSRASTENADHGLAAATNSSSMSGSRSWYGSSGRNKESRAAAASPVRQKPKRRFMTSLSRTRQASSSPNRDGDGNSGFGSNATTTAATGRPDRGVSKSPIPGNEPVVQGSDESHGRVSVSSASGGQQADLVSSSTSSTTTSGGNNSSNNGGSGGMAAAFGGRQGTQNVSPSRGRALLPLLPPLMRLQAPQQGSQAQQAQHVQQHQQREFVTSLTFSPQMGTGDGLPPTAPSGTHVQPASMSGGGGMATTNASMSPYSGGGGGRLRRSNSVCAPGSQRATSTSTSTAFGGESGSGTDAGGSGMVSMGGFTQGARQRQSVSPARGGSGSSSHGHAASLMWRGTSSSLSVNSGGMAAGDGDPGGAGGKRRLPYEATSNTSNTSVPLLSTASSSSSTTIVGGTMGGLDVFERLASAHTQASQAKVIQRVTVDKDALLHDAGVRGTPTSVSGLSGVSGVSGLSAPGLAKEQPQ